MKKIKPIFKKQKLNFEKVCLINTKKIRTVDFTNKQYQKVFQDLQEKRIIVDNEQRRLTNYCFCLLIWLIEQNFNISPNSLVLNKNKKKLYKNNELFFSISHIDNYYCFIVSKNPIGIDMQNQVNINEKEITNRFPNVFKEMNNLSFLEKWVCLEAYIKAYGLSLNNMLAKIKWEQISHFKPKIIKYHLYLIAYISLKENHA